MDMRFLVKTKPRQERRAAENLERQGVVSFCPMVNMEKFHAGGAWSLKRCCSRGICLLTSISIRFLPPASAQREQ